MTRSTSHATDLPRRLERRTLVCRGCGYGISLVRPTLPACPMCGDSEWAPVPETPARAQDRAA